MSGGRAEAAADPAPASVSSASVCDGPATHPVLDTRVLARLIGEDTGASVGQGTGQGTGHDAVAPPP